VENYLLLAVNEKNCGREKALMTVDMVFSTILTAPRIAIQP
jgi:hypothetical protein